MSNNLHLPKKSLLNCSKAAVEDARRKAQLLISGIIFDISTDIAYESYPITHTSRICHGSMLRTFFFTLRELDLSWSNEKDWGPLRTVLAKLKDFRLPVHEDCCQEPHCACNSVDVKESIRLALSDAYDLAGEICLDCIKIEGGKNFCADCRDEGDEE